MPSPNFPQNEPDRGPRFDDQSFTRRSDIIESPSIRALYNCLSEFPDSAIKIRLDKERNKGPITPERLTEITRATSDLSPLLTLGDAFCKMLHRGVGPHFGVCMPALVDVASKLLAYKGVDAEYGRDISYEMLSGVLAVSSNSVELHNGIKGALDARVYQDLSISVNNGNQLEPAYWSCLELFARYAPTLDSLQRVLDTHTLIRDRIDEVGTLPSEVLYRTVNAVSCNDFTGAFNLVVNEYRCCSEKPTRQLDDDNMLRYAFGGLADGSLSQIEVLVKLFESEDQHILHVATEVAIALGQHSASPAPTEIINRVRCAVLKLIDRTAEDPFGAEAETVVMAQRATAALSRIDIDLSDVESYVALALERGFSREYIPLLTELSQAQSSIFGQWALEPLMVVPEILQTDPHAKEPNNSPITGKALLSEQDLNEAFVDYAIAISEQRTRKQVSVIAAEFQLFVDVNSNWLQPRPSSEGSPFNELSQAAAFVRRYSFMISNGFEMAATSLIPEALSIFKGAEEENLKGSRTVEKLYEDLGVALVSNADAISQDPRLRAFVAARLSSTDWELLRTLHDSEMYNLGKSSEVAALAALSLRAAIEDLSSEEYGNWKKDLITTLSREGMHLSNFSLLPCVIAERRDPQASWSMLEKVSLKNLSEVVIWPIACGISLNLSEGYPKLLALLKSESGEKIAKGMLLMQALRDKLTPEQRNECRKIASIYLEEPGQLGMDALVTYSCLAQEADGCREVLYSKPPIGIDEKLFKATHNLAMARVLSNFFFPA
ncbi:MAG: hypothetical protein NTV65_03075 [Proteobacteria bacterium]|nr:hypothetical protein [Pseudomonadota bacterium]